MITIYTLIILTIVFIVVTYIIGLLYMLLGRFISKYMQKNFGWKGYCVFGAIGVPFHELAHLITAVLFLHKIDSVELFRPKKGKLDGCLGFVKHSYKKTLFRTLGNFFIGAAPMIFGATAIFFMIKFCFPACFIDVNAAISDGLDIKELALQSWDAFKAILSIDTLKSPLLLPLFILVVCIGAHMNMSWPDVKNATAGAIALLIGSYLIPMAIVAYTPISYSLMVSVALTACIYYLYVLLLGLIINIFLFVFFMLLSVIRGRGIK